MLQSPSRIEELVKVFIHATNVSLTSCFGPSYILLTGAHRWKQDSGIWVVEKGRTIQVLYPASRFDSGLRDTNIARIGIIIIEVGVGISSHYLFIWIIFSLLIIAFGQKTTGNFSIRSIADSPENSQAYKGI